MAGQSHMTTALLTEHFRQTPLSLLDEIINTVNELVFKAVDRLEEALSNAPPEVLGYGLPGAEDLDASAHEAALADVKQKEIDVGIMQLESLLNTIVDKDFDKFEIYTLRNILAVGHQEDADIAQWIHLDHYRDLRIDHITQQVTPEDVQLQRRKRRETAKLNIMLKEEQVKNTAMIEQLELLLGHDASTTSPLGFLSQQSSIQASQHMSQLLAQLPQIQQCLADLKSSISQPPPNTRYDDNSNVVKRRTYLDRQALSTLESRGLTATKAESRPSPRRRVNREEVEGLEAVVQALGAADHAPD